jgi:AraC family transcriptional regulator of adaptative response/methylated-DNA-[protein]-cysteine methyltransferase
MPKTAAQKPTQTNRFFTDEARWAAVIKRDRSADGHFYYAVRTTGVYCRPSCASRTARRENVTFYDDGDAAQRAGFRPCRRCKPDEAALSVQQREKILTACRSLETAIELPTLEELARAAGMSRFHFHRLFKAITGLTPKAYAVAHRGRRVRNQLKRTGLITDAIYDAGFNSAGRFYATSDGLLGMTPTQFRQGGVNTCIRFALGECSLGSILVAATDKGVCAILLGDDPDALLRDLQDRFARAEIIGGDRDFEKTVAAVIAHVEMPSSTLDLQLDIRGTVFQERVWQALQKIPPGSTLSYSELARQLGTPNATRAVAQACAANAIAVAIPCHRVVRNDGSLSGYRWGVERKRELLERERNLKR